MLECTGKKTTIKKLLLRKIRFFYSLPCYLRKIDGSFHILRCLRSIAYVQGNKFGLFATMMCIHQFVN